MVQFVETSNAFGRWYVGRLWRVSVELAVLAAGERKANAHTG